jgi:hypothetical protein
MIGLHCCGDLTPSMLRIASDSKLVRGIVAVSCCYNRLSIPAEFPLRDGGENTIPLRGGVSEIPRLFRVSNEQRV